MKDFSARVMDYIEQNQKEFRIGTIVVIAIIVIMGGLALYDYNTCAPKIVYEPANACDLLTLAEAKTLLGQQTIRGINKTPVQQENLTVSSCAYSDGLPDTANAKVAALTVRSGINDKGIEENKQQFNAGKPSAGVQDVKNIGDAAYFNTGLGQLNILKDSTWVIVSYGSGATPQENTLADDLMLAKLVLNQS